MLLNMGQILSIPFVVAGVTLLVYSLVRGKPALRITEQEQRKEKEKPSPLSGTHGTY
jgi:prolipoprotein diacylglyceryltransferase